MPASFPSAGIAYNSTFMIRFQQYDDKSFIAGSAERDGQGFDCICVAPRPTVTVTAADASADASADESGDEGEFTIAVSPSLPVAFP